MTSTTTNEYRNLREYATSPCDECATIPKLHNWMQYYGDLCFKCACPGRKSIRIHSADAAQFIVDNDWIALCDDLKPFFVGFRTVA
jgi:hypothetical protein